MIDEYIIREIHDFLEPQDENTFHFNKSLMRDYITEKTVFEAQFCKKYDKRKMEELIQQLPEKIILEIREEGLFPDEIPPFITRPMRPERVPKEAMHDLVNTFYRGQVMGGVLEHYMRKVLSEVYPEKVTKPTATLDPETLIREIVYIPDEKLSNLYTSLAEYAPKDKQLEYLQKAFELDKKHIDDVSELGESYYWYAETLIKHDQLDEAVKVLKEGIKKFKDDIIMYDLLLRAFVKKKHFKMALKQVELILAMDPSWMDDYIDKAEFTPLRALPEYEKIVKKYQTT
ncbi:MAG: tetratricopeptide repeat protein [Candidatus Helarchaeota archaeon]